MRRRDFLKGAALVAATPALAQDENENGEQELRLEGPLQGPFSVPTVKFDKANQHVLPDWAFNHPIEFPPIPLPTKVGRFEDVHDKPVFGPQDTTKLGQCFHGIAREWGETPDHFKEFGCDPNKSGQAAWEDKIANFGTMKAYDSTEPELDCNEEGDGEEQGKTEHCIPNWSGFHIKCYKLLVQEGYKRLRPDTQNENEGRFYGYAGMMPGPTFKVRLGEPLVVRYENQLEAEVSIHLHGGHSPSHSDGFPTFYTLQGKSRDYFYPNILPLYEKEEGKYVPDLGEAQSTMWYHDHAMDATAYNVSKGLAGFYLCFGEEELKLIHDRVLPGYGPQSCIDPTLRRYDEEPLTDEELKEFEDPENPGYYAKQHEPYHNPFDIPLVLQDKVIDKKTGQIAYDLTGHDGYLGDTMFVNGVAWPKLEVRNRQYRFRILDGSNARVYRLRIMKLEDYEKAVKDGIDSLGGDPPQNPPEDAAEDLSGEHKNDYDNVCCPYLRIGKDSWLWSYPVKMKSLVLAMANRADIVVDFDSLAKDIKPGEKQEFVLVNTMPQFDGRGPKPKLEDGGDPRVLPLPFDVPDKHELVELKRPIGLMKFEVVHGPPGSCDEDPEGDADNKLVPHHKDSQGTITGTPLITTHRKITDDEVEVVREFIFERGKGAWQINGRFYDPFIANAAPVLGKAEEWVLRNGGGGWWHPIHIHLESHQLVRYEKDFNADNIVDRADPPQVNALIDAEEVQDFIEPIELRGLHDTQVLGPNTVARVRMRHRTWYGPFVFHCHNLEHEDMRMMYNFEPVPAEHDPNIVPDARTHGNDVTLNGDPEKFDKNVGELPWEYPAVPSTPVRDAGEEQIPPRPKAK